MATSACIPASSSLHIAPTSHPKYDSDALKTRIMKITSKGQIPIPKSIREQAGLHPHSEVEFEVRANASQFKGMGTDEFMALIRR